MAHKITRIICLIFVCFFASTRQMPLRWSPCFKRAKSVYQRVVTHPGARLFAGPEDKAGKILRDPLATFTVMYIYDRQGTG